MRLTFGTSCDGASYPDFPTPGEGAIGSAIVGPSGLLDAIEIELGLTRPHVAPAVRVATYMAKLGASLRAPRDLFFAKSFALDPWATAAQLLGWRDQLVGGGWLRTQVGFPRLDALAHAEGLGPELPPGLADRAHAACRALQNRRNLDLEFLQLVEPRHMLPPPWDALVTALERIGVEIAQVDERPSEKGDLRCVQDFLAGGPVEPLCGDGSFVIVEADTALAGAEAVAEWVGHCGPGELAGTVVISEDGDTALLDHAMQMRALPALGISAPSPLRGALQILPLAFAVTWAPFDAKALLDLLLLPRSPLPGFAARRLARALRREPGSGGAAWSEAWTAIEEELSERLASSGEDRRKADRRMALWREWTAGGLHARGDGMPVQAAKSIAARVAGWAVEVESTTGDQLLLSLASAASALLQALDLLEADRLSPQLIGRVIEHVLADGARNPDHVPTAGDIRAVRDPGAIVAGARNVIWWSFVGPGSRPASSPWSHDEAAALLSAGIHLERPVEQAARIAWTYANAARRAGERLILVVPALLAGDETVSHPLAHQLMPLVAPAREAVRWKAEDLLEASAHRVAGRDIIREVAPVVSPPRQRARWNLPNSVAARLGDRVESASSFERLVDCNVRWLVLDVLRLPRGSVAQLPGTDQLVGDLAHELARRVLPPGPVMDPHDVSARVEALFDELLLAVAAPLAQPGLAGELAAAKARLPASLAQLARRLRAIGVEVVGTEIERSATFDDGLSVNGRMDLVVRHPVHGLGVIDLKWTKSARRRRAELAEGRAIQLATYGAILGERGDPHAPAAFYLLNQRRLIGPAGSFLADEVVEGLHGLPATWANVVASWRIWRDRTLGDVVVATGASGAAEHVSADLPIAPGTEPCRYCELNALCRVGVETN